MEPDSCPLVSVVTPVYNGEKYLPECIESVLAQTYQHWEYIIVNNCSTDRTFDIARHYANKDARLCVYGNDRFLNVMENHTHAFQKLSPESKYCKVLQADDWLFPDCIEKMVHVAEANPGVGIVGSYRLEEREVSCDGLPYASTVVSGREICRQRLLGGPYLFGSPTTILVRSDLIRSREYSYDEHNLHSDVEACFAVLRDYDFGYVHQVLSFTRRHNESETSFIKRIKTYCLANLRVLTKYGPVYLGEEEYRGTLKKSLKEYYRFLGKSVFETREKRFWDYHRTGMAALGYPWSRRRVAGEAAIVLYNALIEKVANLLKLP